MHKVNIIHFQASGQPRVYFLGVYKHDLIVCRNYVPSSAALNV